MSPPPWVVAAGALLAIPLSGLLAAGPAGAAVGPLPERELEVTRLAEGVYAMTWKDPLQDPIEGNSLVIVNDDDVVVDTALLPSTTRRLIAELEKITDKPVRYVVNTHWHDDHHDGNYLYRELWPEVTIISHAATLPLILEHTYKPRPGIIEEYKQAAARFTRWSETGLDDEGKELVERRRKRADELATFYSMAVVEITELSQMPPDLTFTDELVLQRGERTIELRWLGRGNTAGDLVVFLPKERIVATGDLLVYPIPLCFGSYYDEWIDTLAAVDALPVDVIVPGHGPVKRDRDYLHTVQELLRAIVAGKLPCTFHPESFLVDSGTSSQWMWLLATINCTQATPPPACARAMVPLGNRLVELLELLSVGDGPSVASPRISRARPGRKTDRRWQHGPCRQRLRSPRGEPGGRC